MYLTPIELDRLALFTAAEPVRRRANYGHQDQWPAPAGLPTADLKTQPLLAQAEVEQLIEGK